MGFSMSFVQAKCPNNPLTWTVPMIHALCSLHHLIRFAPRGAKLIYRTSWKVACQSGWSMSIWASIFLTALLPLGQMFAPTTKMSEFSSMARPSFAMKITYCTRTKPIGQAKKPAYSEAPHFLSMWDMNTHQLIIQTSWSQTFCKLTCSETVCIYTKSPLSCKWPSKLWDKIGSYSCIEIR